ncbi:MAG: Ig-like domain-containing protein, partial [Marinoscillum sp.]
VDGGDTEGAVTFTITFTDDAGNVGNAVTSTTNSSSVEVDLTDAVLTTVSLYSDNTYTDHASSGDVVTIDIVSDDDLYRKPIVSFTSGGSSDPITGTVTVDSTNRKTYKAYYTVSTSDTEGALAFSIDYTDDAGHEVTGLTTSTSGSIEVDYTEPMLSSVSLSTDNGTDDQYATTGDVVTLSFDSDDDLSATPTVTFTSGGVTLNSTRVSVSSVGGNSYEATYTVLSSDVDGALTFTIDFVDDAGNGGIQVTSVDDGSSVEVDKVKPVVTFSNSLENPTNEDPFDITATFDEQITGLTTDDFTITNGAVVSITDANPVFTVRVNPTNGTDENVSVVLNAGAVIDDAGNANNVSSTYNVAFDDVPPVPSLDTLYLVGRTVTMDISLDEVGNLYYAVLPNGGSITNTELMDTSTYSGTVIYYGKVLNDDEFSEEFTLEAATNQTDYDLFYVLEDLVDSKNLSNVFSEDIKTGGVVIEAP